MLDAFIIGFWQVLAWPAFGYMLIGIAIGFFVGLLPGIGGLATLALMLPFSYSIKDPISAFAFLLGMLAVTGTTGDLTSVLFGIPGEGSSAALILDGYPMTKNGEAGRALGAAITSSVVGAIIGALSLALSIPIMRPLVLLFGSPELFIIAIMGITFIGTLAGASLIKGLLAGGLGLMLAAIGVDPQTGSLRYTFGGPSGPRPPRNEASQLRGSNRGSGLPLSQAPGRGRRRHPGQGPLGPTAGQRVITP
jgi:putative tricarboxylic transport membrane protein